MFKALFNIIIDLLATIVQLIMSPFNAIIRGFLPDISDNILSVSNMFGSVFNNMTWALDLVPDVIVATLMFFMTCEIAKHSIYIGTHVIIKVWSVIQRLKFW